jgi:O-acetylserine/cysteine efflux transporter
MRVRHVLLALAITAIWGSNFVVMRYGIERMPPLVFATLRFVFALLPAVFFIPRPKVPWSKLAAFGLLTGVGQFGLLFIALMSDISPGLASLVIQTQVFFTVWFAARLLHEAVRPMQLVGMAVAAVGLLVIGLNGGASATPVGVALVLLSALCWARANLVIKTAGSVSMLGFVVWSSLFAAPALLVLSLVTEGPHRCIEALRAGDVALWAAVLWQSAVNTLFGYAAWGWLLARYTAAAIAPVALLIPIFGLGASALLLGESMPSWKLFAACLVLAGSGVSLWGSRFQIADGGHLDA